MRDIRDDIADRFAAIIASQPDWRDLASDGERNLVHALATECIRQMEWARHECPFEWAGTPDLVTKAGSRDAILTAAPADWSPPK